MTGFADPGRTHVLMITNHGIHSWQVVPGLPDTGGQNVYVNALTAALVELGHRVTIANRGGYPDPVSGSPRTGTVWDPSGHARISYLEDGHPAFVRKEDMASHIPALAADLAARLEAEADDVDVIVSHYWDGAEVGRGFNQTRARPIPHVWVPHSLGTIKKSNMDPAVWESLRVDERISLERGLVGELTSVVATSSLIRTAMAEDYGRPSDAFLPPCIDTGRIGPRPDSECAAVWPFLARHSTLGAAELRRRRLVTEISRTDRTKRKDVLIRAFARVRGRLPDTALVVALDPREAALYASARDLIGRLGLENDVVVVGSIWDELPCLYNATTVYCTPSVMEGFGMSAQEAAATGVPVVASDLVPFAVEYLLGPDPETRPASSGSMHIGAGGIVVPADDVAGFADALTLLLTDEARRVAMGRRARDITIPYFTWPDRTRDLMAGIGVAARRDGR